MKRFKELGLLLKKDEVLSALLFFLFYFFYKRGLEHGCILRGRSWMGGHNKNKNEEGEGGGWGLEFRVTIHGLCDWSKLCKLFEFQFTHL